MLSSLRQSATHNVLLKTISLIVGFTLWFGLSRSYTTLCHYTVPVALYNVPNSYQVNAPEAVHVTLAGKRNDFDNINPEQFALHIDGSTLHVGNNQLIVSQKTLFLPDHINVISYSPVPSIITVTQRVQTEQKTERSLHAT